jgi:hypothetical protein
MFLKTLSNIHENESKIKMGDKIQLHYLIILMVVMPSS